jgi:hypothetical protein
LCPKGPLEEWFRFYCIFGKCKDYGVKSLKLRPHKIYGNGQLMQWKCFQKVSAGLTRAREGKKGHKTESFETLQSNLVTRARKDDCLKKGTKNVVCEPYVSFNPVPLGSSPVPLGENTH